MRLPIIRRLLCGGAKRTLALRHRLNQPLRAFFPSLHKTRGADGGGIAKPSDRTGRAVFLSYASQDTDAARRACDALRASGLEAWFDQSELRGADVWDQKIRR